MDPPPGTRASSAKSAARRATPKRTKGLVIVLLGLGALLLLGWGVAALRRAQSTQAQHQSDGVLLAQRRAGEILAGSGAPSKTARSPESDLPATPTVLPLPGTQRADLRPGPRYIIRDSAPPRPAPGHLFVDTQPQSTVWIDGEAKGRTPLDVMVGSGAKLLRLEAQGFRPVRETFEAGQGAIIRRALVPLNVSP